MWDTTASPPHFPIGCWILVVIGLLFLMWIHHQWVKYTRMAEDEMRETSRKQNEMRYSQTVDAQFKEVD